MGEPAGESAGDTSWREREDDNDLNDDVQALQQAWVAEVVAPDLLQYHEVLVHDMVALCENMQAGIHESREADGGTGGRTADADALFTMSVHQMSLDRVRFALVKYLRTRLLKLEKHAMHILFNEGRYVSSGCISRR